MIRGVFEQDNDDDDDSSESDDDDGEGAKGGRRNVLLEMAQAQSKGLRDQRLIKRGKALAAGHWVLNYPQVNEPYAVA